MWTLILLVHAGFLSETDSVALTNVSGFASEQTCLVAGKKAKGLTDNTKKETKFVCVKL